MAFRARAGSGKQRQSARMPAFLASIPAVGAEIAVRTEITNADEMLRKRA